MLQTSQKEKLDQISIVSNRVAFIIIAPPRPPFPYTLETLKKGAKLASRYGSPKSQHRAQYFRSCCTISRGLTYSLYAPLIQGQEGNSDTNSRAHIGKKDSTPIYIYIRAQAQNSLHPVTTHNMAYERAPPPNSNPESDQTRQTFSTTSQITSSKNRVFHRHISFDKRRKTLCLVFFWVVFIQDQLLSFDSEWAPQG
ncbi:hypothetical protein L208DRAFT_397096 [Tricholoma matsutake]|nr:hypothetical protein L208DRAFT_397096 [Tricholoma matsutake 945]